MNIQTVVQGSVDPYAALTGQSLPVIFCCVCCSVAAVVTVAVVVVGVDIVVMVFGIAALFLVDSGIAFAIYAIPESHFLLSIKNTGTPFVRPCCRITAA